MSSNSWAISGEGASKQAGPRDLRNKPPGTPRDVSSGVLSCLEGTMCFGWKSGSLVGWFVCLTDQREAGGGRR